MVQGSSARLTPETKNLPVDAVIVGIVDSVHVEQKCVYSQGGSTGLETVSCRLIGGSASASDDRQPTTDN